MALAQNLRIFKKIMLAILTIWLCLFSENFSILTKTLILGQPPRSLSDYTLIPHLGVIYKKSMLAISTIWLCLIFRKCLDL